MVEIFHLDDNNHVQHWKLVADPAFWFSGNGSLSSAGVFSLIYSPVSTTQMASYWPSVVSSTSRALCPSSHTMTRP